MHIAKMLQEINVNKACGADSLLFLVRLSWHHHFHSGCIPVQWKQDNVVPVHKKVINLWSLIIDPYPI